MSVLAGYTPEQRRRLLERLLGERLAARRATAAVAPCLVEIQGGSGPALHLVHGGGGSVFSFAALARAMPARPLACFQHPGLEEGADVPASIAELAARYAGELADAGVRRPLLLGGWSMGAMVALEMAHVLAAGGTPVDGLFVIDMNVPPSLDPEVLRDGALARWFATDLARMQGRPAPAFDPGFDDLDPGAQVARLEAELRADGILPAELTAAQVDRRLQVFKANVRAAEDCRPRSFPGWVDLFLASASPQVQERWRPLAAGGLNVEVVPGDHYSILSPPNVSILGARLSDRLERAEARFAAAGGEGTPA